MSIHGIAVRIEKLNKSFGSNHVLKDIDLDIAPGETFSIIGPSGTGKSILLRHIIRLETPDSGQIYFNDQPVFDNGRPLPQTFRSSMVFQSSALFNSLTVAENVGLWLREHRICPEARIRELITEKLAIVGLEGTEGLNTSELSGGMRKRVAIARSLAMEPDLVLYDEPTAELDPVTTDELAETIRSLRKKTGNTTIIVTHDLNFALYLSDRIAMMHRGEIIEIGVPDQIRNSANPIVQRFIRTTTKGIQGG
ncbi:ABC transporter ATP-binding protein [Oryzomonas rubra]|uniref:ATP-binding cassette domain-containing protein n=1 Tax=Oryzomonas rubra TaxID=2509454 RepID=A0A5A9XDU8_9BACT|nr:ATP-binding cassette domain-containing protein [Oryzomonas rubra]KAA0891352.1 ATP-binding cassette domain-containing protein [Oryzomonas rubra]